MHNRLDILRALITQSLNFSKPLLKEICWQPKVENSIQLGLNTGLKYSIKEYIRVLH